MGKSCNCCDCEICSNRVIEKIVLTATQGDNVKTYDFNINKKFADIADENGELKLFFGDHSRIKRLVKDGGICQEKMDFKRKLEIRFHFPNINLFNDFKLNSQFLSSDNATYDHYLLFPEDILADPVELDYLGNKTFLSFEPPNDDCPTMVDIVDYLLFQVRSLHPDLENELILIYADNPIIDFSNPLNMQYNSTIYNRYGSIQTPHHPLNDYNNRNSPGTTPCSLVLTNSGIELEDYYVPLTDEERKCPGCPILSREDINSIFYGGFLFLKSDCNKNCIYSTINLQGEFLQKTNYYEIGWPEHVVSSIGYPPPCNSAIFPCISAVSCPDSPTGCYCAVNYRTIGSTEQTKNDYINIELDQKTHSCCNNNFDQISILPRFRTVTNFDPVTKELIGYISNGYGIISMNSLLPQQTNYQNFPVYQYATTVSNCYKRMISEDLSYFYYDPNLTDLFYPIASQQLISTVNDITFKVEIFFLNPIYPLKCYNSKFYIGEDLVKLGDCKINCGSNNDLLLNINLNGSKNIKTIQSVNFTNYFNIASGNSNDYIDRFCEKNASTIYSGEINGVLCIFKNNVILNNFMIVSGFSIPPPFMSGDPPTICPSFCRPDSEFSYNYNASFEVDYKFIYNLYKNDNKNYLNVRFEIGPFGYYQPFYGSSSIYSCSNIGITEGFTLIPRFPSGFLGVSSFKDKDKYEVPFFTAAFEDTFEINSIAELFVPKNLPMVGDYYTNDYSILNYVLVEFING